MRIVFTILFLFFVLLGFSQEDPPQSAEPIQGYPYLLSDGQERIIGSNDELGALSIFGGIDTASAVLNQPPDTAQSFIVSLAASDEFTSLKTEIRSYWTLEEAAGNAIDSIETADLPIVGTVTRQQGGVIDDCYQFATDGKLGPRDTDFEFTSSFTVGGWFKTTASGAYQGLITNNSPTANRGWDLMTTSGGLKAWFAIRGDWGTAAIIGADNIEDGIWHYIAGSYSSADDTIKLWIDGDLVKSDKAAAGPVYDTDCRFNIGEAWGGFAFFTGYMDEPATWNRELTPEEHLSLYNAGSGYQYPFTGEGSGGDSLTQTIAGIDTRTDTFMVNWAYDADGYPTTRTSDNPLFAFNTDSLEFYSDTTFAWPYLKDTIIKLAFWSGIRATDLWVEIPNYDSVFVDSSDLTPPPQDLPGFDIIFERDFENHTGLPKEYTRTLWLADDWNAKGNYRSSDDQWPVEWVGVNRDSIVVDPRGGTGSNVIQFTFCDCVLGGYPCIGANRCSEAWKTDLVGYHTETYVSYNILLKAGWDWSNGGKIGVAQSGGIDFLHGDNEHPTDQEGFTNEIMWDWNRNGLEWYLYWQDRTTQYGTPIRWNDFQPTGHGIPYNAYGEVVLETDTWYNITTRTVMNTFTGSTANADGILEAFVNGALVERRSGLRLIPYSNKDYGLDWFFLAMFFGGGGPALQEERSYFDDIVVFTFDETVEGIPRGNVLSDPGRVLSLPPGVWPKEVE